jgi:hypothetical protein
MTARETMQSAVEFGVSPPSERAAIIPLSSQSRKSKKQKSHKAGPVTYQPCVYAYARGQRQWHGGVYGVSQPPTTVRKKLA